MYSAKPINEINDFQMITDFFLLANNDTLVSADNYTTIFFLNCIYS